ncbi:MAG: type II toxin-antitoxin system Phd/YefM family antitoxin [Chloroflexota bacterium]
MQTASVSQLKAGLSGYLKSVKAGEEVIVVERGKAIARVVPFTRSGPTPAEYEDMVRAGLIRPAKRSVPPDFWDKPLVEDPDGLVLKALLAEREEGW